MSEEKPRAGKQKSVCLSDVLECALGEATSHLILYLKKKKILNPPTPRPTRSAKPWKPATGTSPDLVTSQKRWGQGGKGEERKEEKGGHGVQQV